MNPTGRKFVSLFLVFSFLQINCAYLNTVEEEREKIRMEKKGKRKLGVELWIQKKDEKLIRGELIAVKQTSLLLQESKLAKDVSIDIKEVKIITIENGKSKFWMGAGIGFLIGGGIGALIGFSQEGGSIGFTGGYISSEEKALGWGIFLGLAGGIIGGIFGATEAKKYKEIQIEGMSQNEIEKILKKLRNKARIRDY